MGDKLNPTAVILLGALIVLVVAVVLAQATMEKPTQEEKPMNLTRLEVATFAGGCFWCMVPPFKNLAGVQDVISGYMGGSQENPTYEEVSSGRTGYLECVQVRYDPSQVTYGQLLEAFWQNIDPTDSEGQFVDRGSQYKTAIFTHNEAQLKAAEKSKEVLNHSGRFKSPVITAIRPATKFYAAEDYHQDYYKKSPLQYKMYRYGSGRDNFIKKAWGEKPVAGDKNPVLVQASAEDVKKKLSPLQYNVTQECGTEPPFSNAYWNNHEAGLYVDIVSGEPLFVSKDKFDSGTGWPSFTQPVDPNNVVTKNDTSLGMARTEVKSKKGNSHLGHVFNDGPAPTGLRYCINSAALRFIPVDNLEKEGYGQYKHLFEAPVGRAN